MAVKVKKHGKIKGVFWVYEETIGKHLATINLTKGKSVYGENLVNYKGVEYRLWDPYRSKLAAYIHKGAVTIPFKEGDSVLYLGAGSGTTASHISDIINREGQIYCVEFAQRSLRKLVENLCKDRINIFPILADARFPEKYPTFVSDVECIYCDIAQVEQAKILADNSHLYLRKSGQVLIAFKARSIDVTQDPKNVFKKETQILKDRGFNITNVIRLEPFQLDHAMVQAVYQ